MFGITVWARNTLSRRQTCALQSYVRSCGGKQCQLDICETKLSGSVFLQSLQWKRRLFIPGNENRARQLQCSDGKLYLCVEFLILFINRYFFPRMTLIGISRQQKKIDKHTRKFDKYMVWHYLFNQKMCIFYSCVCVSVCLIGSCNYSL